MTADELPTILIAESLHDHIVSITLLDESSGHLIRRIDLPTHQLFVPSTQDDVEALTSELTAIARPHSVSAIVLVLNSSYEAEGGRWIGSHSLPLLVIPGWRALVHSLSPELTHFILFDTTGAGHCSLLRRSGDGLIDVLGRIDRSLVEILHRGGRPDEEPNDVLAKLLFESDRFGAVETFTEVALPDTLEAIALRRRVDFVSALSTILRPLVNSLRATRFIAEYDALVFTGEFFKSTVVAAIFRDVLSGMFLSLGVTPIPEMYFASGSLSRTIGAFNCFKALIEKPGVWSLKSGKGVRLQIITSREVRYQVVHPSRYVFELADDTLADLVQSRPVLAVVDKAVNKIYGKDITRYLKSKTSLGGYVLLDGAESCKTWEQVQLVCEEAIKAELRRDGVILAVGGGVTLDVVGFAAAIYRRGVPYLRIPTTLVGLVDVGVGIKQGVNLGERKNILGAFYPAMGSINDPTFLRTLSKRDINCGIAEIAKMGIIRDKGLFELIERHGVELTESRFQMPASVAAQVIARAEQSMMQELQPNLYEFDLKRLVDFGHTFSPTIEAKSAYRIPHGEAVGMDMFLCTFMAVQRQLCDREVLVRLRRLFEAVGLPISQDVADAHDLSAALDGIRAHRGGNLNLVVPTGIGSADFVQEVDYAEVHQALVYAARL